MSAPLDLRAVEARLRVAIGPHLYPVRDLESLLAALRATRAALENIVDLPDDLPPTIGDVDRGRAVLAQVVDG